MTGTYKVSTNTTSLGTSAKFGAADINKITQTLNGDLNVDTPDINSPFTVRSGKLLQRNPANTFSYIVTNGAIVADRIVNETVLTGTDTRVYQAHTQTLSNKTLDSSCVVDSASLPVAAVTLTGSQTLTNKTLTLPIISSISNTGTVTFPTDTDTLVGRDTTDTLTNKTLTSPTINTPTLGAPLTVANGGTGAGTLTGVLKGNGTSAVTAAAQLAVADGGTGAATLTGILKGNGTGAFTAVTAPSGAIVGDTDTQNLTNKTLDSTNTISSATSLPVVTVAKGGTGQATATLGFDALSPMTAAGDVIIGGASGTRTRLGIGTANQLLRTNAGATAPEWASTLSGLTLTSPALTTPTHTGSGGTITYPAGPDTLVGRATTDTLTNKTLTAPIISTISNTGTITLPTSTDTLVGKDTTDTLTNKTLTTPTITDPTINTTLGSSTTFPAVFPMPPKRWGLFYGLGGSATPTSGALSLVQSVAGSGAFNAVVAPPLTAGVAGRWATGATINSIIGHRVGILMTERDLNFWMEFKCYVKTITNCRFFVGVSSATTAPTSTADYLANLSGVGFKFDTGVHATNISIMQNSGGASSDITTLANVGTMSTAVHTYRLRADNANSKFQYSFDGGAWADINTVIPAATTGLNFHWFVENLTASSINFDIMYFVYRQDG